MVLRYSEVCSPSSVCTQQLRIHLIPGVTVLSHPMNSNYSNVAQLKDLMTAPPMTAAQHAEVMRKRIAHRRMVEEARELKRLSGQSYDQR